MRRIRKAFSRSRAGILGSGCWPGARLSPSRQSVTFDSRPWQRSPGERWPGSPTVPEASRCPGHGRPLPRSSRSDGWRSSSATLSRLPSASLRLRARWMRELVSSRRVFLKEDILFKNTNQSPARAPGLLSAGCSLAGDTHSPEAFDPSLRCS